MKTYKSVDSTDGKMSHVEVINTVQNASKIRSEANKSLLEIREGLHAHGISTKEKKRLREDKSYMKKLRKITSNVTEDIMKECQYSDCSNSSSNDTDTDVSA